MRRITGLLVLAAGLASGIPGTAQATPTTPAVTVSFVTTGYQKVGAGWVAAVACRAVALPTDPQVTALTTTVHCAVNEVSKDAAMVGAAAYSEVLAAVTPDFTFCVAGTASFLDTVTNDIITVAAVPHCITFQP